MSKFLKAFMLTIATLTILSVVGLFLSNDRNSKFVEAMTDTQFSLTWQELQAFHARVQAAPDNQAAVNNLSLAEKEYDRALKDKESGNIVAAFKGLDSVRFSLTFAKNYLDCGDYRCPASKK